MASQLLVGTWVAVQSKIRWLPSVSCRSSSFVSLQNALTTFSVLPHHPVDVGLCSAGKSCSVGYYRLTAVCWHWSRIPGTCCYWGGCGCSGQVTLWYHHFLLPHFISLTLGSNALRSQTDSSLTRFSLGLWSFGSDGLCCAPACCLWECLTDLLILSIVYWPMLGRTNWTCCRYETSDLFPTSLSKWGFSHAIVALMLVVFAYGNALILANLLSAWLRGSFTSYAYGVLSQHWDSGVVGLVSILSRRRWLHRWLR